MTQERYSRQVMLPEIGTEGQERLAQSHIVVIGAGGLGSPVLLYLTAAGVGHITVVDCDVVSVNNLQRQVLYTEAMVGKAKAIKAAEQLRQLNSEVEIVVMNTRFTPENAAEILKECELLIDCTDNIPTRRTIDHATRIAGIPWIHGSIGGWQGQVTLLNYGDNKKYYSDIVDDHCDNAAAPPPGVLGALPGVIGSIMAAEAVKVLTQRPKEELLSGKLLWMNLLRGTCRTFDL